MHPRIWPEYGDPVRFLERACSLRKPSERKLWLLAVAFIRCVTLLDDEEGQRILGVIERYADGEVTQAEMDALHEEVVEKGMPVCRLEEWGWYRCRDDVLRFLTFTKHEGRRKAEAIAHCIMGYFGRWWRFPDRQQRGRHLCELVLDVLGPVSQFDG